MTRRTLLDIPLRRLRRILKATERAAGPDSREAAILRRAIAAKQAEAGQGESCRPRRGVAHG
jgi:hypothetical protein